MVIIVVEAMELVMLIGAMSFIVTVMVVMEVMVVMIVIAVEEERDVCCVYPYPTFNHVTMWRFRNNLRLAGRRINLCRSRPSRKHFTR